MTMEEIDLNPSTTNFKPVKELTFGFSDAENYRRRENKDLFNKIFLRTDTLEKITRPSKFFLVGEKGTGKTAYAVYLSNSPTPQLQASHKFIRETDYHKFIHLKNTLNLSISDYTDIWKVIILIVFAKELNSKAGLKDLLLQYPKFASLNAAIDEYYNNAFSPEIVSALQIVENSQLAAQIMAKHAGMSASVGGSDSVSVQTEHKRFQTNLLTIQKQLEDALRSIKIPKDFIIFVDGIDIRPSSIPYTEYLECVKGLANAAWSLDNDFFPSIRDSKGRMRTVLLLRPDIFNSLGLQNRNTKLKDNSIILNWITDYRTHRNSELFAMADRLFASQQESNRAEGDSWDHYFPFEASSLSSEHSKRTSFVVFLRYSYHRPRDILTMLDFLGEIFVANDRDGEFRYEDMFSGQFKESYGNYLLGEVKDSLSFYYDEEEYELFLKFFEFLNGRKRFDYDHYQYAFMQFNRFMNLQVKNTPDFMKSSNEFLQFLYDQNILCFIENAGDETFIRWCFRERSSSNISPKIKTGMTYELHYGIANTLNTGKILNAAATSQAPNNTLSASEISTGEIILVNKQKGFGFIKQAGIPIDIYFRSTDCVKPQILRKGDIVTYKLRKSRKDNGGLSAVDVIKSESK